MTNQEIKTVGQTIAAETQIGGNTAERVGGVIEGIGDALDNKDAAVGYYLATMSGSTIYINASSYRLGTGGNLRAKMPAAATTACTLTVGNANAVQLWYNGAAVSADNSWEAGEIVTIFYDGTRFMASNSQGGGGQFGSGEKIKDVLLSQVLGAGTDAITSQKGVSDAIFNEIDVNSIDTLKTLNDALAPSSSLKPTYYTVTATLSNVKLKVGSMAVISDNMRHVVTEIMATHYLLDDAGNLTNEHSDAEIFFIYRSVKLSGGTLPDPAGIWSKWRYVNSSIWSTVAEKIKYDNSQSGLAAENVQGALDEVNNAEYADSHKLLFSNSISYIINMAGNWTVSKSSHYLVDVRNIDAVRITANNSNDCTYYWLTSNTAPANQNPAPISTINGNRYTIPAGQTAIGIVPTDAQYLYLIGTHYSLDHKPTQVIAAINFNSVADSNEEIDSVVWNDISRNARYTDVFVDNSGNESASTIRATTMLINAVNGIGIVANEGYAIRAICYYNNDGVFISRDWFASPSVNENVKYNGYVRFIVSKEDNTDIALADAYSNFTITSKEYNAENNAKLSQVGFVEVNPYVDASKRVVYSGKIENKVYTNQRLLWYPMKKGDTIHILLDGAGNRSTAFYAALNSTSAVIADLRWTNAYVGEPVNTYYTAEEDGFIAVTYNDSWDTSYTFAINHADDADFDSTVVPKIACGTKIVSRLEDTYCHAPMIHETTKYRFICYHGSNKVTQENTNDVTYVVLLVIDKTNGRSKYINVYDTAKPDYIDGNKCTVYYNQSIIGVGSTNTLMIRVGCQCNSKWIEIYKTYNADTGVLSAAAMQKLSYNGNTYDFNLANYITMVNTLYNKSFTVVQLRVTNEITSMCYYNNKYYCVMAYFCHDKIAIPARFIQCPHIFAVSDDAITWTPIANVTDDYYSAETLLTIVNDIVYHVFRSDRLGEFYMVFDMQGNVLKAPEPTNNPLSKVWSKPAIAYSGGRVLIGFNKVYDDGVSSDIYSLRAKMCLAEISQTAPYGLTEYKTYVSANGWNYYYFTPEKNGNLLIVNVEDSRGLNDNIHQVVTDINICEVDMLELTESN